MQDVGHQVNSERRKLGKVDLNKEDYTCTKCGHRKVWVKPSGRIECTKCGYLLRDPYAQ